MSRYDRLARVASKGVSSSRVLFSSTRSFHSDANFRSGGTKSKRERRQCHGDYSPLSKRQLYAKTRR